MSKLLSSKVLPNVISSPASAAGVTRSALPVGRKIVPSGPEAVHANRSLQPGAALVRPTSGTSGLCGTGSLKSVDLQRSLGSKLRRLLENHGSTLFLQTWNMRITPSRRRYLAHTASVRRTSVKDCTSWRTPVATTRLSMKKGSPKDALNVLQCIKKGFQINLNDQVHLSSWQTPVANESNGKQQIKLSDQAFLASWKTPMAHDVSQSNATVLPNGKLKFKSPKYSGGIRTDQVHLATWPTPKAVNEGDNTTTVQMAIDGKAEMSLARVVHLVNSPTAWPTPVANQCQMVLPKSVHKEVSRKLNRGEANLLTAAYLSTHGSVAAGSHVATENQGQLNPALSRWLQGFPIQWDVTAILAYRKTCKTRQKRG